MIKKIIKEEEELKKIEEMVMKSLSQTDESDFNILQKPDEAFAR